MLKDNINKISEINAKDLEEAKKEAADLKHEAEKMRAEAEEAQKLLQKFKSSLRSSSMIKRRAMAKMAQPLRTGEKSSWMPAFTIRNMTMTLWLRPVDSFSLITHPVRPVLQVHQNLMKRPST